MTAVGRRVARLATGTGAHLRTFVREPTTLALLLVLPPVVVGVYGSAMGSFPALPGFGADPVTLGYTTGALFATAFLAGIVGLFQVISARAGDERLVVCGYPRATLLASRLVTMVLVVALGAIASFAALWYTTDVATPLAAFGALVLGGAIYGLFGVLVGAVLPRELEGSLVLVFLADVDTALSSGLIGDDLGVGSAFPLSHPHDLFRTAVLDGGVADGQLIPAAATLAVLLGVAYGAYVVRGGAGR